MASAGKLPFTQQEIDEAKQAFDHIDLDHDNFLNVDEVVSVLRELKMECTVDRARKLIDEVDSNRNGLVEWEEVRLQACMPACLLTLARAPFRWRARRVRS